MGIWPHIKIPEYSLRGFKYLTFRGFFYALEISRIDELGNTFKIIGGKMSIRTKKAILLITLIITFNLVVEDIQAEWVKSYGNQFSGSAYSIRTTQDGGYIMAGLKTMTYSDYIFTEFDSCRITEASDLSF